MVSVYQTGEYKGALVDGGEKPIQISEKYFALESSISSLLGKRKILELLL